MTSKTVEANLENFSNRVENSVAKKHRSVFEQHTIYQRIGDKILLEYLTGVTHVHV